MRYFYKDPLAAAWMMKHFGVTYYVPDVHGFASVTEIEDLQLQALDKKFYIHPDSLHLLEPQVGDAIEPSSSVMGIYKIGNAIMVDRTINAIPHIAYMDLKTVMSIEKKWGKNKIIQRNGIPFMWPESEE